MVDVVFNESNDMLFMILMIFVHDFLHDFNVVGMANRVAKIKNEINKLVFINNEDIAEAAAGGGAATALPPTPKEELAVAPPPTLAQEPQPSISARTISSTTGEDEDEEEDEEEEDDEDYTEEDALKEQILHDLEDADDEKLTPEYLQTRQSLLYFMELDEELNDIIEDAKIDQLDIYEGYGPGEDGDFFYDRMKDFKDLFSSISDNEYLKTSAPGAMTRSKVSLYQLCDKFNQEAKLQVLNKTAIPPAANMLAQAEKTAVAAQEREFFTQSAAIKREMKTAIGIKLNRKLKRIKRRDEIKKQRNEALPRRSDRVAALRYINDDKLKLRRSERISKLQSELKGGNHRSRYSTRRRRTRKSVRTSRSNNSKRHNNKKNILNLPIEPIAEEPVVSDDKNKIQHLYILNAINCVIENTKNELNSNDHALVKYFEFMKKTYLFYKRKNIDAFHTFNNSIDPALKLYLITNGSPMFNDDRIEETLTFIEEQHLYYYSIVKLENDGAMLGGNASDDFLSLYETFKPRFESFNTALAAGLSNNDDKSTFDPYLELINTLNTNVTAEKNKYPDKDFDKLLQIREYKSLFDKTIDSHRTFATQSPTSRNFQTYKRSFLFNASALVDHIKARNDFIIKTREAAAAAAEEGDGESLSTSESNAAQMISVTVANIGHIYILNNTFPRDIGNAAFDKEIAIIRKVVETNYVASTIDNNIRDAFMQFASEYPDQYLGSPDLMKRFIDSIKLKHIALNNAATESLTHYFKIPKKEHLCTTAQLADAMGTHGSCVGKDMSKKQELEPMDFILKDADEHKYYIGKTIINSEGTKLNQKIIYTAKCNNFFLPEVQVILDIMYGKASLTLSANTSFKSVITTILDIWNSLYIDGASRPTEQQLWAALINEKLYQRLIASGSNKSVGDFFQEINQVAANSGYSKDIGSVLATQIRVGANGDQPSGVRAGWIKIKATPDSVNVNAVAGYVGKPKYNESGSAIDLYPSFFIKSRGAGGASASKSAKAGRGGSKKNKTRKRSKKWVY